ncbi:Protein of unknown function [Bacillus cereus]|nr:Protein of unknown function [Bacillus cereus]
MAKEKGVKVQFAYWCKHEISLMIQTTDNTPYTGTSLDWFNEPVIQHDRLKNLEIP